MPRMKNGITYSTDATLSDDPSDEPVSRGAFIQITRLASGTVICAYCGSKEVPQRTSDIYGGLMIRMDPDRKNTPEEFNLKEYKDEIKSAAAEWIRAETARKGANDDPERLSNIETMMSRRFATTVACGDCMTIGEQPQT